MNKLLKSACLIISCSYLVSACTSTPPPATVTVVAAPIISPPNILEERKYSATHFETARAGAALAEGGHKHAIVARKDQVLITEQPPAKLELVSSNNAMDAGSGEENGTGNASDFVEQNLYASNTSDSLSNHLLADDLSPEELAAWKKHCSGQPLNNEEHALLYRFKGEIPNQFKDHCEWNK